MAQTIRLRRGLEANRTSVTPALGEALWTTDNKDLWIGDGSTAGGIKVTANVESTLVGSYVPLSQKGAANGVATLDASGLVPNSQLPALAITSTFTAADETAQLALTAEEGDVCVRTDENKSYIHNGGTAGDMTDWQELLTPTDAVLSVNGKTGVVSLDTDDISEGVSNLYYTNARVDARVQFVIDDTSGDGDTTLLWSADKIYDTFTALSGQYIAKNTDDSSSGKLELSNTSYGDLSTNGALTVGSTTGWNITLGGREIQARNNGGTQTLVLNKYGGLVTTGQNSMLRSDGGGLFLRKDAANRYISFQDWSGNTRSQIIHRESDNAFLLLHKNASYATDNTITMTEDRVKFSDHVSLTRAYFENEQHCITSNDGGGNFNLRVGCSPTSSTTYTADATSAMHFKFTHEGNTNPSLEIKLSENANSNGRVVGDTVVWNTTLLMRGDGVFTWGGNSIWHAGNDGSGSGLDADTLDGEHASDIFEMSYFMAG